jgi:hypothetical protein
MANMTNVFEQSNPQGVALFRATEAGNLSSGITQQTIDVNASFTDELASGTQQISITAITWNIQGGGYLIVKDSATPIFNLGGSGSWNRNNRGLVAPVIMTGDANINVDSSGMSETASYSLLIEVKKVIGYTARTDYKQSA